MEITREEHVNWCKKRALEYLEKDDLTNAVTSMMTDLQNHAETKGHPAAVLLMFSMGSKDALRKCIEGFN